MTASRPGDLPANLLDVSGAHPQAPAHLLGGTAGGLAPGDEDGRSAVSICVEVGHQDVDGVCDRCGLPRTP